jgi:pyrroline-5-carboxylate reductase
VDSTKIAIIGGGNMGRALIGGLIRRGLPPHCLSVGEASEPARRDLQRDGIVATADNAAAVGGADVVVIAVKPQDAGTVVTALAPRLGERRPVVVSVAAGIQIRSLEAWSGGGSAVVRAMPNRPALVGAGVTGLYAPERVSPGQRTLAATVMEAVGPVVWLNAEGDLDVVTALSGSGPAYFFLLAETMADAAVRLGLEPRTARLLAVETLYGAGALAHASDGDLARLRAEVTSKGGTTAAAVQVLEEMRPIVERAVTAATHRGRELAAQFGTESSR